MRVGSRYGSAATAMRVGSRGSTASAGSDIRPGGAVSGADVRGFSAAVAGSGDASGIRHPRMHDEFLNAALSVLTPSDSNDIYYAA